MHTGSCLCGAVSFDVDAEIAKAESCHCVQCRKWTGHYYAGVVVPLASVAIRGEDHLKWFTSSEKARRGFCAACGSSLFFDPLNKEKHDWIGIMGGAFNEPVGAKMALHIFVAEKGDYYEINDDAEKIDY